MMMTKSSAAFWIWIQHHIWFVVLSAKSLVQSPAEYFSSFARWRCLFLPNQMLVEPCQTIMSKSKSAGWLCKARSLRTLMVGRGCMTKYCITVVQDTVLHSQVSFFYLQLSLLEVLLSLFNDTPSVMGSVHFTTLMTYTLGAYQRSIVHSSTFSTKYE